MHTTSLLYLLSILTVIFFTPLVTLAAEADFAYADSFLEQSLGVLALLLPFVVGIALLFFFWGLAIFILKADDEQERQKGRQRMIWGIIALFVIISVWGFVALLRSITGAKTTSDISGPGLGGFSEGGINTSGGGSSGGSSGGGSNNSGGGNQNSGNSGGGIPSIPPPPPRPQTN